VDVLPDTLWALGLVFARVGALMMLVPGIGDQFVPARVRLSIALFLAFVVTPLVQPRIPPLPDSVAAMGAMLLIELLIGLGIGLGTRMLFGALATAGTIAGMQTGLAMAMSFDPTQSQQGAIFGTFLALLGTTLVFQADAHHWFIAGTVATYGTIAPGGAVPLGDMAQYLLDAFAHAFLLAVQITAPLLLFGIIFNVALGVLNRVAPAIQVFFIAQPLQILLGLALFGITAGAGMLVWLEAVVRAGQALNGGGPGGGG
jgi:flagellar biosynthesis protein FliR